MSEPLVSIIVPLYNGEQTIERCLASIRNQSYKNIEVLIVNDGSKDHSMKVLKKFKENDPRFHILNKGNSGVSDSRNLGMKNARGKYLQFVDGDDWLVKDATETFVTAAETNHCDMIITDYHRVVNHKIYIRGHIPEEGLISRREFAEYMMKAPANFYYGVMWNKFFRTDIVKSHKLKCSRDLNWCEDFLFNLEYLQYVKDVYVVKKPIYYYVKTKGSLVATQVNLRQTIRTKRILFDYYKDLYKSMDIYDENKLRIQMFYIAVARDTGKRKKPLDAVHPTEKIPKISTKKPASEPEPVEYKLPKKKADKKPVKKSKEKKADKKSRKILEQ
ncbi:glycosyltransferase family 2 protein [Anaerocolumna xylanovorans]|uniref:Glycosyltransferase involved in cell wall bisynthesis n=1 Tax=Anaerocolumna xylanovorans DSM 12503 TaxID=1121345 RepID=A0A1M7YNN4_9FIRM|nr:glycosyltransferase [Anaerocolumna xylanovorans]SHO54116.1 Glycosyltransferase involved in cell wall bisynthesis [Anaerocolumna xylanovorans DSM 12503]